MIDSHVHLNRSEFHGELDEVMARAGEAGVTGFLNIGYDLETSAESIALAESDPRILATVGIHPHAAKSCSENTLTYAIRKRLGFDATAHGFRTTASTILNETGYRVDVIERQLAHGERNKVRAAYNRSQYLAERTEMMQWYSDYGALACRFVPVLACDYQSSRYSYCT